MLARLLEPKTEAAYAFLRVVAGLMFAFHGVQKIFGVLTEHHTAFGGQIWIGGMIELIGGLLIAAGLFTRWAALLASGTMAVAYIQFHWKLSFDRRFFPGVNDGEMALLYSILFLYIACRGPGPFSLDRRRP